MAPAGRRPSRGALSPPAGPGRVVLVGTPIGHLGDLSPRAAASLAAAEVIFCEDTRRTRKLLSAASIPAPRLVALHQHNEQHASEYALRLAQSGATVALVTDAGMPGISDPGARLVDLAAGAGVPVEVIPGPAAFLVALVASGLATDRFGFEGFLPRRGRERDGRLRSVAEATSTTVLYEAPHRVARTVADLAAACGPDRRVAIGRELTKLHEEIWRGTLTEAVDWIAAGEPRGEWVIVVAGAPPATTAAAPADNEITAALAVHISAGATRKDAVDAVAADLGLPRRRVYEVSINRSPP